MTKHYELGKEGELLAVDFLLKNQYQVIERNWRFQKAEVDIIARKEDTLICVEVKTRASTYHGKPEEFVSKKKIQLLSKAINEYVQLKDLDVEVRFDIISVIKTKHHYEIEHIKNAFLHF